MLILSNCSMPHQEDFRSYQIIITDQIYFDDYKEIIHNPPEGDQIRSLCKLNNHADIM